MAELPTGTVTFLFTDVEGSTRLWEDHPDAMRPALARHDEILRDAIESHGGHVVKTTGDGFHAVFATAVDACAAASAAQQSLHEHSWGATGPLRVRMGLHTCEAELRDGDYFGSVVNRAARLMAVGHGGQVLVSAVTGALVQEKDFDLRDLGEQRLRDLSRAEHVLQLCPPGVPSEFPDLQSLDALPGNLPVQMTSFLGRDADVKATIEDVQSSRLVTLSGVGGVGKTRLALQVAAELLPELPDGAWFCELATATDDDTFTQVIAATLGTSPRSGRTLEEGVIEYLRNKRALLLLDNCEHLLDAATRLAEQVLQSCPGVRILATSREGLAVAGEHVRPLRSLVADQAALLFVDRARAVAPDLVVDAGTAPAVVEICRRLDGIPLAIELAAARVEAMSPTEIAQLLDERFRLLTGGRRNAVERHQTLRATVDWSYSLLEQRDRAIFDRLAVFAGTFDAAAVAAITSDEAIDKWEAGDALAHLVRQSMVVAERSEGGVTHYSMLETLRQYARERLDELATADAWRRRHATFYAGLAEQLGPALRGPDELTTRRHLLDDLDNFRAAFNWAIEREEHDDCKLGVSIVAALSAEASNVHAYGVGRWATLAVERADQSTPARRHAVLGAAAFTAVQCDGDHTRAESLARAALRDGVPPESPNLTGPHTALATVYASRGEYYRAVTTQTEAVALAERSPDGRYFESLGRSTRAIWLMVSGEPIDARAEADAALGIARELRNPSCISLAQFARGWASIDEDPELALAALEESAALARAGAVSSAFGAGLGFVARIRLMQGDFAPACSALREAIDYTHDTGDPASLSAALWEMVDIFSQQGSHAVAAHLLGALQEGVLRPFSYIDEHRTSSLRHTSREMDSDDYAAARARGSAMTYHEVVDFALTSLNAVTAEARHE